MDSATAAHISALVGPLPRVGIEPARLACRTAASDNPAGLEEGRKLSMSASLRRHRGSSSDCSVAAGFEKKRPRHIWGARPGPFQIRHDHPRRRHFDVAHERFQRKAARGPGLISRGLHILLLRPNLFKPHSVVASAAGTWIKKDWSCARTEFS